MKKKLNLNSDNFRFPMSSGSEENSSRKIPCFVGIKILVFFFLFIFCFSIIAGCLSDIDPLPENPRVFPEALQDFPASRFDGKFWAATISAPIGRTVAINCYSFTNIKANFTDIKANSMVWASSVFNPRHRTTPSAGGTYQPIAELAGTSATSAGVHFETETVGGVEMIVSNFFVAYIDVPAGNIYFDDSGNWKIAAFVYPDDDFTRLGSFANSTIAQLAVIEDYVVTNGRTSMRFNFPTSFYVQRFSSTTSKEDKVNDLKSNLIERNKSWIASGSSFEGLWQEHFLVTDENLTNDWKMKSSAITGSEQTLDCGRDYDLTGKIVN